MYNALKLTLIAGLALSANAYAVVQATTLNNGSFANGLSGWDSLGDVSVQGNQAILTTASTSFEDDYPAAAGAFNRSGTDVAAVGVSGGVEQFANLTLGALDPDSANGIVAYEGSVLKQSFSANAGDTLNFQWNFLTNEGTMPDYAFVVIDGTVTTLAHATEATLAGAQFQFQFQTGNLNFGYQFANTGLHTLSFGVVDVGDYNVSSALTVSGVQVTAVPEPETYGMLLAGLGLLGAVARRRHSR